MATKKIKATVDTVDTVDTVWEPVVINNQCDDILNYTEQFQGRPDGRYVMIFQTPLYKQSISVAWSAENSMLTL